MIKKEVHTFFAALLFFTRIPCPKNIEVSKEHFEKCSKYLPLIGWIVCGFSAFVYFGSSFILPQSIAILFSMLFSVLLTRGLHEDGLADVCDGFGGGWNKEKILSIMKDSATGV
jgi:adenosylcobinamide-GDP ribazoletransferase